MTNIVRTCQWCKKLFTTRKVDVKRGRGNYCTKSCRMTYQKAHGGRGVTLKAKLEKAGVVLAKALALDESFSEYDLICLQEDE